MISAGIDIGSRTVKLVLLEHGKMIHSTKHLATYHPLKVCEKLIHEHKYDRIIATGYGRHLFCEHHDARVISEIKAFSLGVRALFPACRTILDIGGQDTKAIALDAKGKVTKFEMNDKCAAGTGKFLEVMASALGFGLDEFGKNALAAEKAFKINSMCTVFAESEVVSMLAKGIDRSQVALGIHKSIAARSTVLMNRVGISDQVVFVGGVALNQCIQDELQRFINKKIYIPEDPQIIGAYGCALLGQTES